MPPRVLPIANGLRTDHPIPGLPFVSDLMLDLDDRFAIEAIGRASGDGQMWGREDPCRDDGWTAFTTDADFPDYAWVVRFDPRAGRSVLLFRNQDAASIHSELARSTKQLWRAGGYWWDGQQWHRPAQIFDWTTETYVDRIVPGATTVTAHQMLEAGGSAASGHIYQLSELIRVQAEPVSSDAQAWQDALCLWAQRRDERGTTRPLWECVTNIAAPELAPENLLDVGSFAHRAGIASSTLRAYISRGQSDVPQPQAVSAGRDLWSVPVADDWITLRNNRDEPSPIQRREGTSVTKLSPGEAAIQQRIGASFFLRLWENTHWRKRWALRWRTQEAVQEVADDLATRVAVHVDDVVPVSDIGTTTTHALVGDILADLAENRTIDPDASADDETAYRFKSTDYAYLTPGVVRLLTWMLRTKEAQGRAVITEAASQLYYQRARSIPMEYVRHSIAMGLSLDSGFDEDVIDELLNELFPSLPPLKTAKQAPKSS